jgi:hypothetical protein
MPIEEERVVTTEPADTVETAPVQREVVETTPSTVVERRAPASTIVTSDDPVANAWAASQLIQTIVWAVVVLVLLVVALWALHVYAGLF